MSQLPRGQEAFSTLIVVGAMLAMTGHRACSMPARTLGRRGPTGGLDGWNGGSVGGEIVRRSSYIRFSTT